MRTAMVVTIKTDTGKDDIIVEGANDWRVEGAHTNAPALFALMRVGNAEPVLRKMFNFNNIIAWDFMEMPVEIGTVNAQTSLIPRYNDLNDDTQQMSRVR